MTRGTIVAGPHEASDGTTYWTVEDNETDDTSLEEESEIHDDTFQVDRVVETAVDGAEGYAEPDSNSTVVETFEEGTGGPIVDGGLTEDSIQWWKVYYRDVDLELWTKLSELRSNEKADEYYCRTEWRHDGSSVYKEVNESPTERYEREVTSSKRDGVIQDVKNDSVYQAIRDQMFADDGVSPEDDANWNVADVYDVDNDELFQVVDVTFPDNAYQITYNTGSNVEHRAEGQRTEHVTNVEDPYYDQTLWRYDQDNSTVVSVDRELPNLWWCNSVNWGCVLTIAGAFAGMIAACGTCATQWYTPWGWWSCVSCIGTVMGTAGAYLLCDPCYY